MVSDMKGCSGAIECLQPKRPSILYYFRSVLWSIESCGRCNNCYPHHCVKVCVKVMKGRHFRVRRIDQTFQVGAPLIKLTFSLSPTWDVTGFRVDTKANIGISIALFALNLV
jgi:hypothetical protein